MWKISLLSPVAYTDTKQKQQRQIMETKYTEVRYVCRYIFNINTLKLNIKKQTATIWKNIWKQIMKKKHSTRKTLYLCFAFFLCFIACKDNHSQNKCERKLNRQRSHTLNGGFEIEQEPDDVMYAIFRLFCLSSSIFSAGIRDKSIKYKK